VNPERLSRDAVRLVDQVEAEQVRRVRGLLDEVYRDAKARLRLIDLEDDSIRRAIREVQVRRLLEGSDAARRLLDLGRANGPIADALRADIQRVYEDGLRTAGAAIEARTAGIAGEVAAAAAFGTRVDLELLRAITESTLTTLSKVGRDGLERLESAMVRGAVRGAGPRVAERLARDAVDLTRVESERIARTVFQRANSEARRRGYEAAGVEHVQFDATNDTRTCPYCSARHGMVYRLEKSPSLPLHPNCRCVLLPWDKDASPEDRGDAYYVETRGDLREREEITTRATGGRGESSRRPASTSTATAAAAFEKADGVDPPRPVWAPGRGWL
jgi:SPP1 gp7 family putative phage head morphogenesis protein